MGIIYDLLGTTAVVRDWHVSPENARNPIDFSRSTGETTYRSKRTTLMAFPRTEVTKEVCIAI